MALSHGALNAQTGNTLRFNQVILLTNGQTLTVPADRVWKIEGGAMMASNLDVKMAYIRINGNNYYFDYTAYMASGHTRGDMAGFPFWVPAGASVQLPAYANSDGSGFRGLSILEFLVVPQ